MEEWKALFMQYFVDVIKTKYVLFDGRARRKEFWMFVLFEVIISFVLGILSSIPFLGVLFWIVLIIFSLGVIVPGIALGIRRLRDTNRSGFFILLGLIPLVGAIILIVFAAQEGTAGDNQYGPDPKKAQ